MYGFLLNIRLPERGKRKNRPLIQYKPCVLGRKFNSNRGPRETRPKRPKIQTIPLVEQSPDPTSQCHPDGKTRPSRGATTPSPNIFYTLDPHLQRLSSSPRHRLLSSPIPSRTGGDLGFPTGLRRPGPPAGLRAAPMEALSLIDVSGEAWLASCSVLFFRS